MNITRLFKQPLYDTEIVPERAPYFQFFRSSVGQSMQYCENEVKSDEHTNMQQSHMLMYPLKFYLKGIHFFDENYRFKRIDKAIREAGNRSDLETEAALLLERKSIDLSEHAHHDRMDSEQFSSGSFEFCFSGRSPLFKGPISTLSKSRELFSNLLVSDNLEKKEYTCINPGEAFSLAFKWSSPLQLHYSRYVQVFLDGFLESYL